MLPYLLDSINTALCKLSFPLQLNSFACSTLLGIFWILVFPFSRKSLEKDCASVLTGLILGGERFTSEYSCIDCIKTLEGSSLRMALRELAPVQRMNRTAEFLLGDRHL